MVIGTYRVLQQLGEGGMGTVWLAEHTLLGRKAALKLLLPAFSTNEAIVQRFFNEAKAVAAIADPGIVQIFDFGLHTDGSPYIVMELLDGETLDARLRRLDRLSPFDAVRLTRQIAVSLAAAHGKGVIHRDLKPENLFVVGDPAVTGGERPKVLDFGIAKLAGEESKHRTRTGMVLGTPVYMSPEQCRGAGTIDHRTDIYSLGAVLFCLVAGRPPFEGEGSGDVIIAHVRDQPPVPSSIAPGIPPALDAVILRGLEKDPARRYQTMNEFAAALGQVDAAMRGELGPALATGAFRHVGPGAPTIAVTAGVLPGGPPPRATTMSSASGETSPTAARPASGRRRVGLAIGAAIAAAGLLGAGAVVLLGGGGGGEPALVFGEGPTAVSPAVPPRPPAAVPPVQASTAPPDASISIAADAALDAAPTASIDAANNSAPTTVRPQSGGSRVKGSRARHGKDTSSGGVQGVGIGD
jgi:serine/threonine-protein kinase